MAKLPKTAFDDLRDEWYKKLKEDGFTDVESVDEKLIGRWSTSNFTRVRTRVNMEQTLEYYNIAGHFLFDYKFEDEFDKQVWQYHTEGMTVREISEILTQTTPIGAKKSNIGKIIKRLSGVMKQMYITTKAPNESF